MKRKTFKGYVCIQSKTGSDWGEQWPVIENCPIFKTRKEARNWLDNKLPRLSCCPVDIRKYYS